MKHGFAASLLLLLALPSHATENDPETLPHAGYRDSSLDNAVGAAILEATGADLVLLACMDREGPETKGTATVHDFPLFVGSLFVAGPILPNARNFSPLGGDIPIETRTLRGAAVRSMLERAASRFPTYDYQPGPRPVAAGDSALDEFYGLNYEVDLTRAPGERVVHVFLRGKPLEPDRELKVALSTPRASRGDAELAGEVGTASIKLSALKLGHGTRQHQWTVLPDYIPNPERPLIDRLVREHALPRDEALRIYPDDRAQRGDLAYWLARAFGWHESHLSGAYPDVPDSLEPWVDALARRHVLDTETRTSELFQPYAAVTLPTALAWCMNALRTERGTASPDSTLRRELLSNTSLERRPAAAVDTLTRAQALGIVANARFLQR